MDGVKMSLYDCSEKTICDVKHNGKVYTPPYIVRMMLELCGYRGKNILQKHVMENSCGNGSFLIEIVETYIEEAIYNNEGNEQIKFELEEYIHGIDIDKNDIEECSARLSEIAGKHGIYFVSWDLNCGDTLCIDKYNGKMDYVIGNPPYVRIHNMSNHAAKRFNFSSNGMVDLYLTFYEVGLNMLNDNGVLSYITPSSFFTSKAGEAMRNAFIKDNLLWKVVDMKHFQVFNKTTYTAICVLHKNKDNTEVEYYEFDSEAKKHKYITKFINCEYIIDGRYYFSSYDDLSFLNDVLSNKKKSDITVKNGYATLCDSVFINDYPMKSRYIIPVVKASRGIEQKIFFPYDKDGELVCEEELMKDKLLYNYLMKNKDRLINRDNESNCWYSYGRKQGIADTYKDKVSINTIIRDERDLKLVTVLAGSGVYGGLYATSETIPLYRIECAINNDKFARYISILGKYKQGWYYTYSSKDVKTWLDYYFNKKY